MKPDTQDTIRRDRQLDELDIQAAVARQPAPKAAANRRRRRLGLAVAASAFVVVAAVPGSMFVRAKFFPPVFPVASIRQTPHYQDKALLSRAWQLPVAQRFQAIFAYQRNPTSCGPSSLANVSRSFGEALDEGDVVRGSGKCWAGICFGGLTLDELAGMARSNTAHEVTLLRDLSYDEFKRHLRQTNDPRRRYIVNFQRGLLFGKGMGHHSPLGGYLEREDEIFVLDVNEHFKPWLVSSRRLFEAVNGTDASSGKKRGLLLVEMRLPSEPAPLVSTQD
jgi:hypothetical protein